MHCNHYNKIFFSLLYPGRGGFYGRSSFRESRIVFTYSRLPPIHHSLPAHMCRGTREPSSPFVSEVGVGGRCVPWGSRYRSGATGWPRNSVDEKKKKFVPVLYTRVYTLLRRANVHSTHTLNMQIKNINRQYVYLEINHLFKDTTFVGTI